MYLSGFEKLFFFVVIGIPFVLYLSYLIAEKLSLLRYITASPRADHVFNIVINILLLTVAIVFAGGFLYWILKNLGY